VQHELTGLIRLAVARLDGAIVLFACGRVAGDPMRGLGHKLVTHQQWMLVVLHDDEHIAREIFGRDVPRLFGGATHASERKSLALPKRVIHEAPMRAEASSLL
jgi:hypothetical protein